MTLSWVLYFLECLPCLLLKIKSTIFEMSLFDFLSSISLFFKALHCHNFLAFPFKALPTCTTFGLFSVNLKSYMKTNEMRPDVIWPALDNTKWGKLLCIMSLSCPICFSWYEKSDRSQEPSVVLIPVLLEGYGQANPNLHRPSLSWIFRHSFLQGIDTFKLS